MNFTYVQQQRTLVFGAGSRGRLAEFVEQLGVTKIFVITDPVGEKAARAAIVPLRDRVAMVWSEVLQHVPDTLATSARDAASKVEADAIVSFGGGSATGLAKAIALTHGIPIIAIPTTYAGSEQTMIYGITGGRHKQTGTNPMVLPKVSLYDAELTLDLPPQITGASAFNALAHCVNGLSAVGANPVTSAIALEGIRAIRQALPLVMAQPRDLSARENLQYGAAMAGVTLGDTSTGLHHKICHVLGGTFNLVHADAHSVILPHSTAFNAASLPHEMQRVAEVFGCRQSDVAGAIWDLAKQIGVPTSLPQLGLDIHHLDEASERATEEIKSNPRLVTVPEMRALLADAFAGIRPREA